MQNRKALAEKQKAEKAYRAEMAKLSKLEREAKAKEPVKASVPNKLTFGANMVKFEPPKN
jgi:hypothetical protein